MYNSLDIKDLKFNLLIDIKYPKSNSYINNNDFELLKQFNIGILEMTRKVSKLEFEAVKLFNSVKAFQAIVYTHEKDHNSSNKHIHAILSCNTNNIENIVKEITTSLAYLKIFRSGFDNVLYKAIKNTTLKDKAFKDTIHKVRFWELKGNNYIYYIAPIVQIENIYTYINKHQINPFNNLNYILK